MVPVAVRSGNLNGPSRPGATETASRFVPGWWCRNRHVQTLWPRLRRFPPMPGLRRERLELPDGDFLDLDWLGEDRRPVAIIVHGLEGSSRSPYARGLMRALAGHGWRPVVLNLRGCSGEPNRLPRAYHSGETGDLDHVVQTLRARPHSAPRAIIGYSAGGNILLKWLGERGADAGIAAAAAVSVPYRLDLAVEALHRTLFGVYERYFLANLLAKTRAKLGRLPMPVTRREVASIRSLREFDDRITAPLHGFAGAADYYQRASSRPWLARIRVPTLLIHAADDPFMTPAIIPSGSELSPSTRLEVSPHGGHVGFLDGPGPWRSGYWLERRLPAFLAGALHPFPETAVGP